MTKQKRAYESALAKLDQEFDPWLHTVRDSERINEHDLKIVIDAKDSDIAARAAIAKAKEGV